jgi:hypothetical protein
LAYLRMLVGLTAPPTLFSRCALSVLRTAGKGNRTNCIFARYTLFQREEKTPDIDSSSNDAPTAMAFRVHQAIHQRATSNIQAQRCKHCTNICIYNRHRRTSQHTISIVDNYSHKPVSKYIFTSLSSNQNQRTGESCLQILSASHYQSTSHCSQFPHTARRPSQA